MSRLQCTFRQAHSAARAKLGCEQRTKEWQYECWIDGKFQFKVTIPDSHGHQTAQLSPGTLKSVIRQLKLSNEEFVEWRDCPMDRDKYEHLMRERLGLPHTPESQS